MTLTKQALKSALRRTEKQNNLVSIPTQPEEIKSIESANFEKYKLPNFYPKWEPIFSCQIPGLDPADRSWEEMSYKNLMGLVPDESEENIVWTRMSNGSLSGTIIPEGETRGDD